MRSSAGRASRRGGIGFGSGTSRSDAAHASRLRAVGLQQPEEGVQQVEVIVVEAILQCRQLVDAASYHDHNWGVWRATTWNWGQGRGRTLSLVYGGVTTADSLSAPSAAPYFLAAVDSQGVRQILRFGAIDYQGRRPVPGVDGVVGPDSFRFRAVREPDTVEVAVSVLDLQATRSELGGGRVFLQMRGAFRVRGRLLGAAVADSGLGFFETFVEAPRRGR